ncbi:MAG: Lipopolysaccharide biosynthesis protein, partial [Phycisphaerales bacterium]|nr:Lipopolysaccharide biosynthesis protein [Phycisphaerales bacterium]
MKFTGERYIPSLSPEISYEHWHRYVFTAELAAGKSVLDIASGEGYGSHFIARVAERVVGIDLDPEAVAHAARQYARPNLEFRAGSVDAIPIEGRGVFDMVVSFETIEHVGEEAQSRFCEEVVRLLKPNGILLVSTPDKAAYSDAPKYHNEFHRREFYKGEFVELLSRFFPSVRLFGQKVYAGSHVWRLEGTQSPLGEYQLAHSEDRFRPATADLKQPLYLLAVCSNAAGDAPGDSVLIDASGLTTPVLRQDLSDTMQAVCDLRARVAEQDAAAARAAEASGVAAAGIAARDATIRELEFKVREGTEKSRALAEAGDLLRRESDALRHELAARDGVIVHLQGLIEQERRSREGELNRRLNELEEASARRGKTIQAALGAIAGHVVPAPEPVPTAEERAAEERRYRREMDRMQRTVVATTPEGATVLVVSKGDPDLLDLEGRRGLHFPQSEDGAYAGFHPPDSPTAIAHLEFLRGKGAQFLLFPSTAFWWMDHYPYLREYLDANFDRVRLDGSCLLYRLQA